MKITPRARPTPRPDLPTPGPSEREIHDHIDPHPPSFNLPEVILGGQDGLVNVLGVILGVAAATSEIRVILVAGLAATFSESVSMAAVAYTSKRAEADRYKSEVARERRHIRLVPNIERAEVREIFRKKGFDGEILERIVETVTSDEATWISVMMADEHGLTPIDEQQPLRSALIVGISALVGSLIPLLPFMVLPVRASMWVAAALSAVALFVTGVHKGRLTASQPVRSGLEIAGIGMVSALVGYAVGALLGSLPLP